MKTFKQHITESTQVPDLSKLSAAQCQQIFKDSGQNPGKLESVRFKGVTKSGKAIYEGYFRDEPNSDIEIGDFYVWIGSKGKLEADF